MNLLPSLFLPVYLYDNLEKAPGKRQGGGLLAGGRGSNELEQ